MKQLLFVLTGFFLFPLSSWASSWLKVVYLADHKVACDSLQTCYLIKNSPQENWTPLPVPIEGFRYEEGYAYCLLLEVQDTVISGHSGQHYIFHQILSKEKTNPENTYTLPTLIPDSCKWMLYKLKTADGTQTFSLPKAYLQFGRANEAVNGESGCNHFTSPVLMDSTHLSFYDLRSGNNKCSRHSIEPELLKALKNTTHYKISKSMLYLYREKYLLAIFLLSK